MHLELPSLIFQADCTELSFPSTNSYRSSNPASISVISGIEASCNATLEDFSLRCSTTFPSLSMTSVRTAVRGNNGKNSRVGVDSGVGPGVDGTLPDDTGIGLGVDGALPDDRLEQGLLMCGCGLRCIPII
jgi:hypothetical protein